MGFVEKNCALRTGKMSDNDKAITLNYSASLEMLETDYEAGKWNDVLWFTCDYLMHETVGRKCFMPCRASCITSIITSISWNLTSCDSNSYSTLLLQPIFPSPLPSSPSNIFTVFYNSSPLVACIVSASQVFRLTADRLTMDSVFILLTSALPMGFPVYFIFIPPSCNDEWY